MAVTLDRPSPAIPPWVPESAFGGVQRIEIGLEGDWTRSARTIWARGSGFRGYEGVARQDANRRPAVELALEGGWIGIVAAVPGEGGYRLDEALVRALIARAEAAR